MMGCARKLTNIFRLCTFLRFRGKGHQTIVTSKFSPIDSIENCSLVIDRFSRQSILPSYLTALICVCVSQIRHYVGRGRGHQTCQGAGRRGSVGRLDNKPIGTLTAAELTPRPDFIRLTQPIRLDLIGTDALGTSSDRHRRIGNII